MLGVDPGDQRIGIALCDPTGTIASPLTVLQHVARAIDAAMIAQLASEHQVVKIIVGQALDSEGLSGPAARKAARLADAIAEQTNIPVELWDESGSTQAARSYQVAMGKSQKGRKGHLDDVAAAVILQSYIDDHRGF